MEQERGAFKVNIGAMASLARCDANRDDERACLREI